MSSVTPEARARLSEEETAVLRLFYAVATNLERTGQIDSRTVAGVALRAYAMGRLAATEDLANGDSDAGD